MGYLRFVLSLGMEPQQKNNRSLMPIHEGLLVKYIFHTT